MRWEIAGIALKGSGLALYLDRVPLADESARVTKDSTELLGDIRLVFGGELWINDIMYYKSGEDVRTVFVQENGLWSST